MVGRDPWHPPQPLTRRMLVYQPREALGSCGGSEGAVAGAAQRQQFPEQPFLLRNCHLEMKLSVLQPGAAALPSSACGACCGPRQEGAWPRPLFTLLLPTYIAGQGADKGHEEGDQASLCLQALSILQGKSSAHVIRVPAANLCWYPHSLPLFQHSSPKHPTHLEGLEGAGKTVLGQERDLSIQEEGHHMTHALGSQPRIKETLQCAALGGSPEFPCTS